jgi:hypothetical protein
MTAQTDGHHHNRPNSLSKRIDLSSLGAPTRGVGSSASYAFEVSGPLSGSDAALVIVEALELAAYDHGFLRPDSGTVQSGCQPSLNDRTRPCRSIVWTS